MTNPRVASDPRPPTGAGPAATVRASRTPPRWIPAFVVLSALWGASFTLTKVAVGAGVAPMWVALWRCLLGALALWLLAGSWRAAPLRDRRAWGHVAVVGLLLNAAPFALFAYAATHISSIVAGIWNATTPLTTVVVAVLLLPDERPTARRLLGLALGICGVLVVLQVWHGLSTGELAGNLASIGATTCYGVAFAYTRRFLAGRPESAVSLSAAQVTCATLQLALVTPLVAGAPAWPGRTAAAALLVLGAASTGIAYVLNLTVVRAAGSTVASTVTYATPIWSTLLGVAFLGESVSWATAVGAFAIVAGVVLTRSGGARPAPSGRPPRAVSGA